MRPKQFVSRNMNDSVLVVIVNYRTPALTIDCLRSLGDSLREMPNLHVVVTDNLSGDDSVTQIQTFVDTSEFRERLSFQPLPENGGFAFGNNAAIRPALETPDPPKYILLLNPDTVVRANAITILTSFLNDNKDVGIAGSRLEDPDGSPQRSAFRFPSIASELENSCKWGVISRLFQSRIVAPPVVDEDISTDWIAGASMMIRREVFDAIGFLDEGYFMYFEEVDFCLRARAAGWPCWYVPTSRVVHLVGQASGVTDTKIAPKRRPKYWFDSRKRYFLKNKGKAYTALADMAFISGMLFWKLRRRLQRKPEVFPPNMLGDFFRNSVLTRGFTI